MTRNNLLRIVLTKDWKILFALMIVYKLLLEFSFWKILVIEYGFFSSEFSVFKYLNGWFWILCSFLLLTFDRKRASVFFLFLIYVLQMIPIAVVYSLHPLTSGLYFNLLMISYNICIFLVYNTMPFSFFKQYKFFSLSIFPLFTVLSSLMVVIILAKKGFPSLDLLNVFNVYILRRDNPLLLDGVLHYLLSPVIVVFLPALLVRFALKKKYFLMMIPIFSILLIYLHSGHKTFLFSIFLCLAGVYFSSKQDCFASFFNMVFSCFSLLCLLTCIWPTYDRNVIFVYSLSIRRMLFDPAILKFYHFDYFNTHPFLGLYGAIPRSINPYLPKYYEDGVIVPFDIGKIYFNLPDMSADTGFFAEIFGRFGYFGFVVFILLLTFILTQIDAFQFRVGYRAAISFFLYPMYALAESQIIGSLFFGSWFFLLILLFFYNEFKIIDFKTNSS